MKAIEISDNMILREYRRDVNRNQNQAHFEYSIEPKFGATINQKISDASRKFAFAVQKNSFKDSWYKVKDTTRDELMQIIYDDLVKFYGIYLNFRNWEEKTADERGYRAVTHTTIDGEEYTIHEVNPNPHAVKLQKEQFKSVFAGYWDNLLHHIYDFIETRSVNEIKLVDF